MFFLERSILLFFETIQNCKAWTFPQVPAVVVHVAVPVADALQPALAARLARGEGQLRRDRRDVALAAVVPVLRREEPVAKGGRLQPVDLPGVLEYSTTYTFLAQPHYIDMRTFGHELHEVYDALLKG